jgi:K+-sensing histidine kinase KdpD
MEASTSVVLCEGRDADRPEPLALLVEELRRALSAIRGVLGILECAERLPGAVDQIRRALARHVGQLAVLVDDVPDLAMSGRGSLTLRPEWIDVTTVVAEAFESGAWALRASGRTVALRMPDAAVVMFADRARIGKIVINLLEYAASRTDTFGAIGLAVHALPDEAVLQVFLRDRLDESPDATRADGTTPESIGSVTRIPRDAPICLALAAQLAALHGGTLTTHAPDYAPGGSILVRLPLGR